MNATNTRRGFLATSIGLAPLSLAGCSSPSSRSPAGAQDRRLRPAQVSSRAPESGGWTQIAERTGTVFSGEFAGGLVTVSARQHTTVYEDRGLREAIRKKTLGKLDTALTTFFATRVDLDPDLDTLPFGIGLSEIMERTRENAERRFEKQLSRAGPRRIRQGGRIRSG